MRRAVKNLSRIQQRLGWDAAFVEADAADATLLDAANGKTGVACPLAGEISGGTAAEYD